MLFKMFTTFFLIGGFTIGGGIAMIPVIEKEIVTKKKWLTIEEFLDVIAIAQSIPGVLTANMSMYIGYKIKGVKGAAVCLIGAVTPSISIIMLIARFFYRFRENPVMDKVFIGVRPAVAAIMATAVYKLAKKSKFKYFQYFVISAVVIGIECFRINPAFFILAGIVFSVILSFKRKEE